MRRLTVLVPLVAVLVTLSVGPFCASALAGSGGPPAGSGGPAAGSGSAADSQYFDPLSRAPAPTRHAGSVKLAAAADRSPSTDPAEPIAIAVGGIAVLAAFACGIVVGRRRRGSGSAPR